MPRIRSIKPEMFGDEKLAPMPVLDRFVFVGLIAMADDAGRLVNNVKSIDGFIFPETDDSARASLERLAATGLIVLYVSASGQKLIQLANWSRHQKVDHPAKYVLPAPLDGAPTPSREPREDRARSSRSDLRPTTYDQGPSTNDLRPTTADVRDGDGGEEREALADEHAAVAAQLPTKHRADLDELLARMNTSSRPAWLRTLAAMLAGDMAAAVAPPVVGIALREFNAAGAKSARLFRGLVRKAAEAPPTSARDAPTTPRRDDATAAYLAEQERQAREAAPALPDFSASWRSALARRRCPKTPSPEPPDDPRP